MDHRLEELSGGEQQRVAVAIALANRPRLLLADEPTGELDTATAKTIYDLFRDLNRKLGLTIVIVSHDPGIAQHVDRVVAVRDGKLASESVQIKPDAGGFARGIICMPSKNWPSWIRLDGLPSRVSTWSNSISAGESAWKLSTKGS